MLYLDNNTIVKGKPRYVTKLDALKRHQPSTSGEQYFDHRFQLSNLEKQALKNDSVDHLLALKIPSKF